MEIKVRIILTFTLKQIVIFFSFSVCYYYQLLNKIYLLIVSCLIRIAMNTVSYMYIHKYDMI